MNILKGNAVVGQSGGPTAAINATLSGVIRGALWAKEQGYINTLYGMRNGIEGFLEERLVDLTERFEGGVGLENLESTPAAALGSCRKKMKSPELDRETYEKIFEIFKKYDIRYFFYIGGNDSMDTVSKLSQYAKDNNYEIRVVGVPKTIDNDLMATDHTPGFGSAAKFVATVLKEIIRDISVYTLDAVTIVEIMGRDAGWLTASAALTQVSGGIAPDLIYLPEKPFDADKFIECIKSSLKKHPAILVAVSEGIRYADGTYVGASTAKGDLDAFGHAKLSGAGKNLEWLVKEKIGCKVRSIELNLPQRAAGHLLSATDINESVIVGKTAVEVAVNGNTGIMMTIERVSDAPYQSKVAYAEISNIANEVRRVPDEYINAEHNGITEEGIKYLAPLIVGEVAVEYENGLPKHTII